MNKYFDKKLNKFLLNKSLKQSEEFKTREKIE